MILINIISHRILMVLSSSRFSSTALHYCHGFYSYCSPTDWCKNKRTLNIILFFHYKYSCECECLKYKCRWRAKAASGDSGLSVLYDINRAIIADREPLDGTTVSMAGDSKVTAALIIPTRPINQCTSWSPYPFFRNAQRIYRIDF